MVLPVIMMNSLKGWQGEFIFLRVGDLEFMPQYKRELKTDKILVQQLGEGALTMVYDFYGAETQDTFNDNVEMHDVGCIPKLLPRPNRMSAQLKDLTALCKKIGGLNNLKDGRIIGDASKNEVENLSRELKNLTTEAARENVAHKQIIAELRKKQHDNQLNWYDNQIVIPIVMLVQEIVIPIVMVVQQIISPKVLPAMGLSC
ncbi:hypothetical protein AgCh_021163 [Apium graveolens]